MSIQLSKTEEEIMHFFWKEEKFYDFSTLMNHLFQLSVQTIDFTAYSRT